MSVIVETKQGKVEGREKDGVLLFAGVPYAAPPVGRRRFRPPEPHDGWQGVRDAKRFGAAAPQLASPLFPDGLPKRQDEDCLFLNIHTPASDDKRRPVFVWIHGGGFRTGQSAIPWYNGHSFASRGDIVAVSLNYRLGALAFTHLAEICGSDFASSGTLGTLDQIAALRWIQENIAAFGGDPERVTIAGESAGGMSTGTLLGCPQAAGLFRAAIPQSGAMHHPISAEDATRVARELVKELGTEDIEALQGFPVERILEAQGAVERRLKKSRADEIEVVGEDMPFRPCVDGRVLPQPPLEALRAGLSSDVAVMVGWTRHETTLWGAGLFGKTADQRLLHGIARQHLPDPERAIETYRKSRPGDSDHDIAIALTTDHIFRIPALRLAEAHTARGGRTYVYEFSWEASERLRATHALEIPFAFNNLNQHGLDFFGPGPFPQELADSMHNAWIAFVRSGDPNGGGLPKWPTFDPKRCALMEFGDRVGLLENPGAEERALWDGIR